MSIQTNSPSTNLGTSVSADGIATTLGYADAATLTAAIDAGAEQAVGTTDSPQFAGINLGHASDTTLTRTGAGVAAIEGAEITTNTGTQTLSNKTLTAPKLAAGGYVADANGNELLIGDTVTSAVNEITVANAATGANPKLSATGGDTNIGLDLQAKGTGTYNLLGSAAAPAEQRLYEDTDNGTNYVGLKAPASVGTSVTWTLPPSTGAGKVLTDVNGDNVLTMETPSGGGVNQLAIFRRTDSDQTGISGSYATDYLQYNTESSDEGSNWSVSGDEDFTCGNTGRYLILQHFYGSGMSGAYLDLSIGGSALEQLRQVSSGDYQTILWIADITAAQVLKFRCTSASTLTMAYTDGTRPGKVNFVEILRIA